MPPGAKLKGKVNPGRKLPSPLPKNTLRAFWVMKAISAFPSWLKSPLTSPVAVVPVSYVGPARKVPSRFANDTANVVALSETGSDIRSS